MTTQIYLFLIGMLAFAPVQAQMKFHEAEVVSPFFTGHAQRLSHVVDAVIERIGPTRNQWNTNLCTANTVADIISFHTKQRVSTASVAMRSIGDREGFDNFFVNPLVATMSALSGESRYMAISASGALNANLNENVCEEDQLDGPTYAERHLKAVWEHYKNYRATIGEEPVKEIQATQNYLQRIFPSLDTADFIPLMSPYTPLEKAVGEWMDQKCSVKLSGWNVIGDEWRGRMSGPDMLASIDNAFQANTLPAFHYEPGVYYGNTPQFWQLIVGTHVSSILAKARIDDKTFYLVRNSYGEDCTHYSQSINNRCDRGHFWFTEQEVLNYGTSTAHLQPLK